jgi:hypothetical protein
MMGMGEILRPTVPAVLTGKVRIALVEIRVYIAASALLTGGLVMGMMGAIMDTIFRHCQYLLLNFPVLIPFTT